MGLIQDIEKVLDELKAKLTGKVSSEIKTDVQALVDDGKAQATQLLKEAGADAQADASKAAGDASQVASDAGAAVAPPAQPAS